MNNSCKGTEGFTLVELLVTLSLLSIMAIYAFNAFGLTGKMKTVARGVESDAEVQTVLRHFHDDVSTLTAVYRQDPAGSAKLIFEGSETSLSYVAFADGTKEVGGLYQVNWQLNDKHQLTIERHLLGGKGQVNVALVVLDDVESVTFTYNGDKTLWRDQQTLPRTIVLKLALSNRESTVEVSALIVAGQ